MNVDMAGMGIKRIRAANLPPEVPNDVLQESLASYGKVLNIHAETWAKIYRYPVSNGVRQVVMHVTQHLPSHLTIAGYRVLLSYEGQPATCYGCGEIGHLYQVCPARRATGTERQDPTKTKYASVLANTTTPSGRPQVDTETTTTPAAAHSTVVNAMTTTVVPDRETDTSTMEQVPPMTMNIDNIPVPAKETAKWLGGTSHLDDRREGMGLTVADRPQSNDNSRRKSDTRTQCRHWNRQDSTLLDRQSKLE